MELLGTERSEYDEFTRPAEPRFPDTSPISVVRPTTWRSSPGQAVPGEPLIARPADGGQQDPAFAWQAGAPVAPEPEQAPEPLPSPEPEPEPERELSPEREAAASEPAPSSAAAFGIADVVAPRPARRLDMPFQGRVVDIAVDEVDLGGAGVVRREYTNHPGAVVVVALDDDGNVLLLRQYRHPVGSYLWELPAGLLDIGGEDPHVAAARELAEEADVRAARWDVLLDLLPTPGGSNEAARVYLARGLSPVPEAERHTREAEEADMVAVRVPLEEAAALALAGRLHNGATVSGILAAAIGRASSWRTLRPVDAPWEYRRN